ncbi:hypothetical protein NM10_04593 [Megasphaera sp. NM10]|nr:hypothetical protein NM10_04593 [Megasphaera sp. NM10]
MAMTGLRLFHH